MKPFIQKVIKPWGHELIITPENYPVTGKVAFTKSGHRWSLQFHEKKKETLCLISGECELWLENEKGEIEKIIMEPLSGYQIDPFKKHRFCAIKDCISVEFSTPEEGNTVRLEDDYSRHSETEETRKLREKPGTYMG